MAKLYIITGPAGVGKSSVSKLLAERSNKSALIEGDEIYHQVVGGYAPAWKEGNHLDVFWKICAYSINTYLEAGYDVVFNYIVNQDKLAFLKEAVKNSEMKFVVLMVDEETLMARDAQRPEDCRMNERCVELLNSFRNKGFDEEYVLDTSNLSVEDTAKIIEDDGRFVV